jgi:transcription termination factor Rho
MSVLSRGALHDSPLADLHQIASALGIDGYRRLRKEDLVAAILERQGGDAADGDGGGDRDAAEPEPAERPARSRGRRGGRSRSTAAAGDEPAAEERPARERRSRPRDKAQDGDIAAEGIVEILTNGSGFIRAGEGESDDDVYISAAQVRRCDLVAGDRVGGPARPPRRSERFASLIRVETINGSPAEEVSAGTPYSELPAAFPSTPIAFTAKDPVLKQIADLAPIGRGSRVVVAGESGSGRSTTLRALALELAAQEDVDVKVVLAGARPEEQAEWTAAELSPAAVAPLASAADAQAQAVEGVVDAARRSVARGGHAAVVIDSLDGLSAGAAQRALAAARSVPDGGTLTIVAAARAPLGGETTVIALAPGGTEKHPLLDAAASRTLRVEALVGARKATTILKNRAKALAE